MREGVPMAAGTGASGRYAGSRIGSLQFCYNLMREGVPMAAGTGASGRYAGSKIGGKRRHLQFCHNLMRDGVPMAAGTGTSGRYAGPGERRLRGGKPKDQLQTVFKLLAENPNAGHPTQSLIQSSINSVALCSFRIN